MWHSLHCTHIWSRLPSLFKNGAPVQLFELGEFWYVQLLIATLKPSMLSVSGDAHLPESENSYFARLYSFSLLWQVSSRRRQAYRQCRPSSAENSAWQRGLAPNGIEYPRAWPCLVLCENPLLFLHLRPWKLHSRVANPSLWRLKLLPANCWHRSQERNTHSLQTKDWLLLVL